MNFDETPCPIIFDLDGTLIDSAPDIHAAVNAVLREHKIQPLTLDQLRSFVGNGVDVLWQRIIAARGLPLARHRTLLTAFMTRYHNATALTRLYPSVLEAVGALSDRGHPLGICTNKPMRPTRAVLDHMGLSFLFQVVIAGDSLPQRKPDPAPLFAAMAELGTNQAASHAIYVGDSEVDAETARAASVPMLLFTKGYRRGPVEDIYHTANFDDFAQLPALIEAMITK